MLLNRIDGYKFLHRGVLALADVEAAGMRVDMAYFDNAITTVQARITKLESRLRDCEEYQLQRRRYGQKTNLTSRPQLASVLFEDMGFKPQSVTATGRPQLDEKALERVGTKYTQGFLRLEKLIKLHSTYLLGIKRELEGQYLHAFFGLHLVRSYRGQSDSPNLQNIPLHDPIQGEIIRKAFIPRDGHVLVEVDYSSLEVMIACALSGDKKLTHDATEGDMHRDMAAECFLMDKSEVTKEIRFEAKTSFVFAEFYGDWYKQVAANLWDAIKLRRVVTKQGMPLREYLLQQGITERGACDPNFNSKPGTFEDHIRAVEDRFWNERFKVYNTKRREWVEEYKRKGYIDLVTGFRCWGPMTKNQAINYHIQGPAFHCLLMSLITLLREIRKRKMYTKVVAQIHDSILADVPVNELDDYIVLARDIAVRWLLECWDWITVPLKVEVEVAETNWYEKKPVKVGS